MFSCFDKGQRKILSKIVSVSITISFLLTSVMPGYAQSLSAGLPSAATMLAPTGNFNPVLLRAIEIDPKNPLHFGFVVDSGDTQLKGDGLTEEAKKLIRYFLASLTTPEKDMWVNLSPYEKDRIIPDSFGQTQMGRDLLAQDYILKQLTASLIYPEDELGKKFWEKIYKTAYEKYGTTDIPVDTFNKIWILPKKATVYESNNRVFVVDSELTVMMEEDYLALQESQRSKGKSQNDTPQPNKLNKPDNSLASSIVREVVLPAIEKEVNFGKNFASLRQVYSAMILATWYKNNLKESLLGKVYMDQNKIKGIDLVDRAEKQKIYDEYLNAFKKGIYDFIKVEQDQYTGKNIPRKYFSGGFVPQTPDGTPFHEAVKEVIPSSDQLSKKGDTVKFDTNLTESQKDKGVSGSPVINQAPSNLHVVTIDEINSFAQKLNMDKPDSTFNRDYFASLIKQYLQQINDKSKNISHDLVIGKNFFPNSMISRSKMKEVMNSTDFATEILSQEQEYLQAAKNVEHRIDFMNGGAGTSVGGVGAKSMALTFAQDLQGFDKDGNPKTFKNVEFSILDVKYVHNIIAAQQGQIAETSIRELVSKDTVGPISDFRNTHICLLDKIDDRIPEGQKRTYAEYIKGMQGIHLDENMVVQAIQPVIDVATGELTDKKTSPGGHGVFGRMAFEEILTDDLPQDKVVVRDITNGDGPNNQIPAVVLGWMAAEKVPMVLLSSTTMELDKKGGKIGAQPVIDDAKLENLTADNTRINMMETVQAGKVSQGELFQKIGLSQGPIDQVGQEGEQFFNTNIMGINETVLQPFLKELEQIIGHEEYVQWTSPTFIDNPKENGTIYQVEGALGHVLQNLDYHVRYTKNQKVKDLMKKYGWTRLLHIVNFAPEYRELCFTPVKFALDWNYYLSEHFSMDTRKWMMQNNRPGHLARFEFSKAYEDYYQKNKAHAYNILPLGSKTNDLDLLYVSGKWIVKNPKYVGTVELRNETDKEIDLNQLLQDGKYQQLFDRGLLTRENGYLILDNVIVTYGVDDVQGKEYLSVVSLKPVTVTSAAGRDVANELFTKFDVDPLRLSGKLSDGRVMSYVTSVNINPHYEELLETEYETWLGIKKPAPGIETGRFYYGWSKEEIPQEIYAWNKSGDGVFLRLNKDKNIYEEYQRYGAINGAKGSSNLSAMTVEDFVSVTLKMLADLDYRGNVGRIFVLTMKNNNIIFDSLEDFTQRAAKELDGSHNVWQTISKIIIFWHGGENALPIASFNIDLDPKTMTMAVGTTEGIWEKDIKENINDAIQSATGSFLLAKDIKSLPVMQTVGDLVSRVDLLTTYLEGKGFKLTESSVSGSDTMNNLSDLRQQEAESLIDGTAAALDLTFQDKADQYEHSIAIIFGRPSALIQVESFVPITSPRTSEDEAKKTEADLKALVARIFPNAKISLAINGSRGSSSLSKTRFIETLNSILQRAASEGYKYSIKAAQSPHWPRYAFTSYSDFLDKVDAQIPDGANMLDYINSVEVTFVKGDKQYQATIFFSKTAAHVYYRVNAPLAGEFGKLFAVYHEWRVINQPSFAMNKAVTSSTDGQMNVVQAHEKVVSSGITQAEQALKMAQDILQNFRGPLNQNTFDETIGKLPFVVLTDNFDEKNPYITSGIDNGEDREELKIMVAAWKEDRDKTIIVDFAAKKVMSDEDLDKMVNRDNNQVVVYFAEFFDGSKIAVISQSVVSSGIASQGERLDENYNTQGASSTLATPEQFRDDMLEFLEKVEIRPEDVSQIILNEKGGGIGGVMDSIWQGDVLEEFKESVVNIFRNVYKQKDIEILGKITILLKNLFKIEISLNKGRIMSAVAYDLGRRANLSEGLTKNETFQQKIDAARKSLPAENIFFVVPSDITTDDGDGVAEESINPGGILMSSDNLDLQIKRDGNGIPLPVSQQPIESMNIQGFSFQIMSITPVPSLFSLSGLGQPKQEKDDLSQKISEAIGQAVVGDRRSLKIDI